nr:hypothetical protein [uncultured Butyrivibrio sp.]
MHHFDYVTAKEAKPYRDSIIKMTNELQDRIRERFTFQYYFIGSSSRNMITYDVKSNVGFDFDINYAINDENQNYGPDEIHRIIYNELQRIFMKYDFNRIEESTRVITLKKVDIWSSKVLYSCDIALVNDYEDDNGYHQEYIRFNKKNHSFLWAEQPAPYYLEEKAEKIKASHRWNEVRNVYLDRKNNNDDSHKKSRALYAEAVHEVFMRI